MLINKANQKKYSFDCNGINFSQDSLNLFLGLNAVDCPENVKATFEALQANNMNCARMGAYKPRTSPHSFQGLGKKCLPYVIELANEHSMKVIAMEVTHESQITEIYNELTRQNSLATVMLQIGTRNAQNFELLKAVGRQNEFPILYKRGYGITLDESLAACEYIISEGNQNIVFCLRGMKSLFSGDHRNFVDVAHIPMLRRLITNPIGFDPSHSVGRYNQDIFEVSAQAVIAGANLLLVDVHPFPEQALVDSKQAMPLSHIAKYLADISLCRNTFKQRSLLHDSQNIIIKS